MSIPVVVAEPVASQSSRVGPVNTSSGESRVASEPGVGQVVVTHADHIDVLAATRRRQPVLMGSRRRRLANSVLDCPTVDAVGMYTYVSGAEHHCVSYPSAVSAMMSEMSRIRHDHGVMLTRIALGGRRLAFGAGPGELSEVAAAVDETLDDACATLRYPRPAVVVSAVPA